MVMTDAGPERPTMTESPTDVLAEPPDEPVVHWMERPPSSLGPATVAGALGGVFLLGVLVTLGAMAVGRLLESHDDDDAIVLRRIR
jgi:hypothetical protein